MSRTLDELKQALTVREYGLVAKGHHLPGITVKEMATIQKHEGTGPYSDNAHPWFRHRHR